MFPNVQELATGTGDLAGGTFIDQEFIKYVQNKVGLQFCCMVIRKECEMISCTWIYVLPYSIWLPSADTLPTYQVGINVFKEFEETAPIKYMSFMGDWERSKRAFAGKKGTIMDVPTVLQKLWSKKVNIADDVEEIELSPETIRSFFKPTLDTIVKMVKTKMRECGCSTDCAAILLVGGPAGNAHIKSAIESSFPGITVFTPNAPGSIVVRGGVEFALAPQKIYSRRCRKTYGVRTSSPFIVGKHKESKKTWHEERENYYADVSLSFTYFIFCLYSKYCGQTYIAEAPCHSLPAIHTN